MPSSPTDRTRSSASQRRNGRLPRRPRTAPAPRSRPPGPRGMGRADPACHGRAEAPCGSVGRAPYSRGSRLVGRGSSFEADACPRSRLGFERIRLMRRRSPGTSRRAGRARPPREPTRRRACVLASSSTKVRRSCHRSPGRFARARATTRLSALGSMVRSGGRLVCPFISSISVPVYGSRPPQLAVGDGQAVLVGVRRGLAVEEFRGGVGGRQRAGVAGIGLLQQLGQAEVRHLDAAADEQDIGGLMSRC